MLSDVKRGKVKTKILKIVINGSDVEVRQEEKGRRENSIVGSFPITFIDPNGKMTQGQGLI